MGQIGTGWKSYKGYTYKITKQPDGKFLTEFKNERTGKPARDKADVPVNTYIPVALERGFSEAEELAKAKIDSIVDSEK